MIKKLKGRLTRWKQKCISFGGRITLIKSVLSCLPLFYLYFYRMPQGVINHCNKIMQSFLWGKEEGDRGITWINWDAICKPKELGDWGLGIGMLLTKLSLENGGGVYCK